jgi:alkanesulfonate monooxygenase SsuD/methylene tetrahydromethanopterin reductase-like flavin-dependent oxidoreductase (luciferase family)
MTDVRIGVSLPQFTSDPAVFRDGVERAVKAGLDSIWVFDHLWPLSGGKTRAVLEGWTSLAWAAAATEGIEIGTLVTRSSLRHPAVLAKMAATVSAIAPGRTIVAIGSGDRASKPENDAYGIPYYAGERRLAQLRSTVAAVKGYTTHPSVSLHDEFASISDLPSSPRSDPPPRIWIGGRDEDLLRWAGETADGWNGWGATPERFAQDAGTVAEAAGERPVELSWGGQAIVARSDAAAAEQLGDRNPSAFVVGGPETVAARLAQFVDAGARHLVLALPNASDPEGFALLGGEIRAALEARI